MLQLIRKLLGLNRGNQNAVPPSADDEAVQSNSGALAQTEPQTPKPKRLSRREMLRARRIAELEERKKLRERKRVETIQEIKSEIVSIVGKHAPLLKHKRRTLLAPNEYGKVSRKAWDAEMDLFVDGVLPKRLSTRKILTRKEIKTIINSEVIKSKGGKWIFDGTDPLLFEQYIRNAFEDKGWVARLTPGSGDQGVDVIAQKAGLSIAVQCKLYSSPVGNSAVQEVAAGRNFYKCDLAWVVSNASFTPSARELARASFVELILHTEVEKAIVSISRKAQTSRRAKLSQRAKPTTKPTG